MNKKNTAYSNQNDAKESTRQSHPLNRDKEAKNIMPGSSADTRQISCFTFSSYPVYV